MTRELDRRLAFAHDLADAAGNVIRPYFRKRIAVTDKGGAGFYDPVTEADRGAEDIMRRMIGENFPQDAILGEEFGSTAGTSGYRWVLDPVDGTRAFIAGQPLWGTLIGLEHEGAPVLGVLDQPFLRERFTGAGGRAELRNSDGTAPLTTRPCGGLSEALICTTHPMTHFTPHEREQFWRVESACRLSRYGGDCYAYGLLAMGFVDLVVETGLKRWDIVAIVPIIEGAGGIVTDWKGDPMGQGGAIIAAGDARVHAQALALLRA
ncbi:MAG TPA: histidinol-phosphatase [Micropepsaceae bacterium]|jgi:myo-inositol-1(or 4)-monophosphatase|nr:histidinol-phosphatase [Micropepsaceae bacterium]